MARKSRKLEQITSQPTNHLSSENDISKYESVLPVLNRTAIYARLSLYDIYQPDPDSMKYQVIYVKEYIASYPEFNLVDTYIDNGRTGMNYARPEFIRLLDDIYTGKINCVIVKDLSRFGRNYIETGMYLQDVFPKYGVRFIAINDEYDSKYHGAEDLAVILKNILNDFFSRDISRKISAGYDLMYETGNFMITKCPYGYIKDPDCPTRYKKDPIAAPFVDLIFEWYLSGTSMNEIAYRLTEMKVPNSLRMNYLHSKRKDALREKGSTRWTSNSIGKILTNPVYVGDTVLRKSCNRRYTLEGKIYYPPNEWIRLSNTHDPYITQKQHELILKKQEKNKQRWLNSAYHNPEPVFERNIYHGILKCGVCGYSLNLNYGLQHNKSDNEQRYYCNSLHYSNVFRGHMMNFYKKQADLFIQDQLLQEFCRADFLYAWLIDPYTAPKCIRHGKKLMQRKEHCLQQARDLKHRKIHLLELYQDKILTKEDLQIGIHSLNQQQLTLQAEIEALQVQIDNDTKALSITNPWICIFARKEYPLQFTNTVIKTYFVEILAFPHNQFTCTVQEEVWRDRLLLLYKELEESNQ